MKKLIYRLLVTTSLSTAAISGAHAIGNDVLNGHDYDDPHVNSSVKTSICKDSMQNKFVLNETAKSPSQMKTVEDGYIRTSAVNINEDDIRTSYNFAQLAYKAASDKAASPSLYTDAVTKLVESGHYVTELKGETGHNLVTSAVKSTIGLFSQKDDNLTISFRGSTSLADFKTDATVLASLAGKARFNLEGTNDSVGVHYGFYQVFESYKEQIRNLFMQAVLNGTKTVLITGHSMGGALADLTALHLSQWAKINNVDIKFKVVTYNAPRSGSENYVDTLINNIGVGNHARFEHNRDLAAAAAFGHLFGLQHASAPIIIESNSAIWSSHSLKSFNVDDAIKATVGYNLDPKRAKGLMTRFKEHQIGGYIANAVKTAKDFAKSIVYAKPTEQTTSAAKVVSVAEMSTNTKATQTAPEIKKSVQALPEIKKENFGADFRNKVHSTMATVKETVSTFGQKAKATVVSGFQKLRSGISSFFGF